MKLLNRLSIACMIASLSVAASAATYFVSPYGSDKNAGSEYFPWQTLRKGFTSLNPGDVLLVRGGVYDEILGGGTPIKIRPGTLTQRITVQNYPGEYPVLRGLLWLSSASYWTVDGLNVTWMDGQSSRSHMIKLTNGVGWTFKNARVWGAKSYAGILVAGTVPNEPKNWRILGNTIHDTYRSNDTNQDHLIYCNTGLTAGKGFIMRNLLYNAENGNAIKIGGADATQGSSNVTVRYNTIYNTTQGILVSWRSQNTQIYRNIIQKVSGNYGAIRAYQLTGEGNVAYDNVAYEARSMFLNDPGYQPIQDWGGNWIPMDPQFASIAEYNFRVRNAAARYYGRYGMSEPAS